MAGIVGGVSEVYGKPQEDVSDHCLRQTRNSSEDAVIAAYFIDRAIDGISIVCAQLAYTPS
jgi:hypothetical protein